MAQLRDDPDSILWLYRQLLQARRSSPALALGDVDRTVDEDEDSDVLVYRRHLDDDERWVAINFGTEPGSVLRLEGRTVEVSSAPDRARGAALVGPLAPYEAVILGSVDAEGAART